MFEEEGVRNTIPDLDFEIKIGEGKNLVNQEEMLEDRKGDNSLVRILEGGNITVLNNTKTIRGRTLLGILGRIHTNYRGTREYFSLY